MTIKSNFVIIGIALFVIETCFINYSQAQNLAYRKYIYKWDDAIPPKIEISKQFLQEEAVILSEENKISISNNGEVPTFIDFQKKARIKFLTKEGISKYSKTTLPEYYDYTYDYRDVALKNRAIKKRPAYLNVNVIYFAARIIKSDGRIMPAIVNDSIIKEFFLHYGVSKIPYNFEHYAFSISNLEVGDELEFDYKIDVPYNDNWYELNSARIFFNGNLPKLKYSLNINYRSNLEIDIKYLNNAKPDSIKTIDNIISSYWHFDNLYGCINELGSRPYKSLPYIVYLLDSKSLEYKTTEGNGYIPFWVYNELKLHNLGLYHLRNNAGNIEQSKLFRKSIHELCKEIPDSMKFLKFKKIHHEIVNNFKYQDDHDYYTGEDFRKERIGEFVENKIIREISRYNLYPIIFENLETDYYTVYLLDKRFGEMNKDYFMPLWDIEYLFTIFDNNNPHYIYPKKSDFGFYLDELPFYKEDVTGLFSISFRPTVKQSDSGTKTIDLGIRTIITPYSIAQDNIRRNNIKVDINLDSLTTNFDARVSLSGQFSTMNRGCYLYDNYRDSSVNDLYSKRIWDINKNTKLLNKEITSKDESFPFAFNIRANFVSNQLIIKNVTEQTYTLDIKNWFNHIIYDNFNTTNRYLDFYPDFLGQDVYRYYITFDKDIELIEKVKDVELDNSLGKLSIKISQLKPNVIMLESNFIVINEKVPFDKINDVAEIYSNINKLNNSQITFKALQK